MVQIYFTIKWYQTFKLGNIFSVAFLSGFCTLIRPTSIFVIIIPLLIGIANFDDLKLRFLVFIKHKTQLLFAVFIFFIPWIPQFLYWKIYTGSFIFYSYGKEGFDFTTPQLINVLFSFRKGWLLYTPIMVFSLIGFYHLYKINKGLFFPITVYFLITFYVLSCWWCWSWGGSFSNRGLIESYAFLAFPMAAFYNWFNKKIPKITLRIAVVILIAYNLLQTYQYCAVVIHWDNMTKESYIYSLFKLKYTDEQRAYFNTLLEVHSDLPIKN